MLLRTKDCNQTKEFVIRYSLLMDLLFILELIRFLWCNEYPLSLGLLKFYMNSFLPKKKKRNNIKDKKLACSS